MPSKLPDFQKAQQVFANHIRNPDINSKPQDVPDERMQVYRDLFFNNIMSFLNSTFPVLKEIIGESRWQQIGRDFFVRHKCESPYFLEISQEFLSYLESEFTPQQNDPSYMYELAHYEWLELYIDVLDEKEPDNIQPNGDLLAQVPVLTCAVEGFLYQYPVHTLSLDNPNPEPELTAMLVYRDRADKVRFVQTNPFTLQMLAALKEQQHTGEKLIKTLLEQNQIPASEDAMQGGAQILNQWQEMGIILGVRK